MSDREQTLSPSSHNFNKSFDILQASISSGNRLFSHPSASVSSFFVLFFTRLHPDKKPKSLLPTVLGVA